MSTGQFPRQIEFHVCRGDLILGTWTIDEIVIRLSKGELVVTDYVYVDEKMDWVGLLEFPALMNLLRKAKPSSPPPKAEQSREAFSDSSQWFVQKGSHRFGPFTYLGVVRALQEKTVYEFDYIWKNGMENWVRLAEHEDFRPERIRQLKEQPASSEEVFIRRQYARIPFESEVIVHDDREVWMGRSFEGSAGGSGLIIENAQLVPGQVIHLHFASSDQLPAFNALGEIVSKRFDSDVRDSKAAVAYGVRFLSIDSSVEEKVHDFFSPYDGQANAR
jgi:hypothetical protein